MADEKLPPSLLSAKAGIARPRGSTQYLHFFAPVQHDKNQYAFVCESQPLMTFRSHGLPDRCPACGAVNPLTEERE
jgi:hypothetical protein